LEPYQLTQPHLLSLFQLQQVPPEPGKSKSPKSLAAILTGTIIQCHSYDFVHENVGNPALNTRPTIFNHFFGHFYYFRDGLVKSLISNIYPQNTRL
jgi:hypothetical protein